MLQSSPSDGMENRNLGPKGFPLELCVTTDSFQHNALPDLKLLREHLRTRRSQNP